MQASPSFSGGRNIPCFDAVDIQESVHYDERSLRSVCALLDEAKPDLVIWGGDNCYGPEMSSLEDVKAFLDVFAAPMEERKIPWAHIFGNHDHDVPCDIWAQQALYESYPMCVSKHTEDIHGVTNFVLPVMSRTGERVVFNVWGLDTNNLPVEVPVSEAKLPTNILRLGRWDILYFDQLMWYWNTSCRMEESSGQKIPGLMCMHIAPHEFHMATENVDICGRNGVCPERLDAGIFNSGIFSAIIQRGDIRTISCAHTHLNDLEAEYCGIKLCWDACAGYRCYGDDAIRGGRLFEIRENDPWNISTRMIHTLELVEK